MRALADAMPAITILMATLNGARHLPAQLDSLVAQSHRDWRLWISDDGSTDATLDVIRAFAATHPEREVRIVAGPGRGAAANFMHLLCHPDLPPGPVALCDQDDVWLKGKLARAARRIDVTDRPVLYAAESLLVDESLRPFRISAERKAQPSFANALVQNLFGGHTTAMNAAALALVRQAGVPQGIAYHDWWIYQLLSGAGAECRLDALPVALYRQHGGNDIGAPAGLRAALTRAARVVGRDYGDWVAAHICALRQVQMLLTPEARALLAAVERAPRTGPARAAAFRKLGLARSTHPASAALWLAAAFGRV